MPSGSEVELSESWGASGPEVEVSESCTCMGEREGLVVEEWEGLIVTGDSGTSGRLGKASSELVDVRTASSPCCSSSRCLSRSVTGPSSVSRYPSKSSSLSPSSGRSRMYSSKNSGVEGNLWAMCAYEKRRRTSSTRRLHSGFVWCRISPLPTRGGARAVRNCACARERVKVANYPLKINFPQ